MFISLVTWWYSAGWAQQISQIKQRIDSLFDYFSIDLLIKTLFSPFRQISAGQVDGPLGVKLRAFGDRLISRRIGAMIRTAVLIVGVLAIVVTAIISILEVVIWGLLPILPFVGLVMALSGWVLPW